MTDIDRESSAQWRRSSRTNGQGNCVEVDLGDVVTVRDSKHPESRLYLAAAVWTDFVEAVKRGEFDR